MSVLGKGSLVANGTRGELVANDTAGQHDDWYREHGDHRNFEPEKFDEHGNFKNLNHALGDAMIAIGMLSKALPLLTVEERAHVGRHLKAWTQQAEDKLRGGN